MKKGSSLAVEVAERKIFGFRIQRIKMLQDLAISLAKKSLNSGCRRVHIATG